MGWVTGFEPATPGTTNQCSNQLSYTHHLHKDNEKIRNKVVGAKGLEPSTPWSQTRYSNHTELRPDLYQLK